MAENELTGTGLYIGTYVSERIESANPGSTGSCDESQSFRPG